MDKSNPTSIQDFQAVIMSGSGNGVQASQGRQSSSMSSSSTAQTTTNGAGAQKTFSSGLSSDPASQSSGQATAPKDRLLGSPAGGQQPGRKYIELCVNTGEFQKSLGEIEVTNAKCDSDIFHLVRDKYKEVRGFRSRFFLLKPIDVHFVQVN